jgi:predicted nucleotidyltransferase
MMDTEVDALMRELKEGLARIYGTRLRRVYLYGSYARGEQVDGSDVDVLISLDRIERYFAELGRTGELASEVSLRYGVSVSRVFVPERDWEMQDSAFLANVSEDAVAA